MSLIQAEEERAAAFRAQGAARARSLAARRQSLKGSATARRALTDKWRALTDPQPEVVELQVFCDPPTNADPGEADPDQLRRRHPNLPS